MVEIFKKDVIKPDVEDWTLPRVQESANKSPITDNVTEYNVEAARAPQTPLTDEDVAKLAAHRGQAVTNEQRAGMDAARAHGIHHSIV